MPFLWFHVLLLYSLLFRKAFIHTKEETFENNFTVHFRQSFPGRLTVFFLYTRHHCCQMALWGANFEFLCPKIVRLTPNFPIVFDSMHKRGREKGENCIKSGVKCLKIIFFGYKLKLPSSKMGHLSWLGGKMDV